MAVKQRLALIGGRGYTGAELLGLLASHPYLELALATSSSAAGRPLGEFAPGWPDDGARFETLEPAGAGAVDARVWVLALPNGAAAEWVRAIEAAHPDALILDLSADHRFDPGWEYGLTEWNRPALGSSRRVANPGCYATGAQFGLLPLRDMLAGPPVVFGVSGYSGAGRTPSSRNDPERLRDNLVPYALAGHGHEAEIGARLGRPVRFHPHVAQFFRGICLTLAVKLSEPVDGGELAARFRPAYDPEPLIQVVEEIPEIRNVAGTPNLVVGGFTVDPRDPHRASLVVVLDNLLKGAASQALQNINLALGLDELAGLG